MKKEENKKRIDEEFARARRQVVAEGRAQAFSIAEFALLHGVSAAHVRDEIREGHLAASRFGRRVLITAEGRDEWIRSHEIKSAQAA